LYHSFGNQAAVGISLSLAMRCMAFCNFSNARTSI
jgi:hypothetical protein